MQSIGMLRNKPGVQMFEIPKPEIRDPDDVLVRMKEVGLDGTDYSVIAGRQPDIAKGTDRMVLGHEGVGVVEEVGPGVKTLAVGDAVVDFEIQHGRS